MVGDDFAAIEANRLIQARRVASQKIQRTPLSCDCPGCDAKKMTPPAALEGGWYAPKRYLARMPKDVALAEAAYALAFTMCEADAYRSSIPAGHDVAGGTVATLLRFALERVNNFLATSPKDGDLFSIERMERIAADNLANRCYRLAFRNAIEIEEA